MAAACRFHQIENPYICLRHNSMPLTKLLVLVAILLWCIIAINSDFPAYYYYY